MSAKLTKDQKREKKKREERKLKTQRIHEERRQLKNLGGLMTTILNALDDLANQEELDAALLRVGRGKSPEESVRGSRFQGKPWDNLRQLTTRMVSLLQSAESGDCAGLALQGRVYLNGAGSTDFSVSLFPVSMAVTSQWKVEEVVQKWAQELAPPSRFRRVFLWDRGAEPGGPFRNRFHDSAWRVP